MLHLEAHTSITVRVYMLELQGIEDSLSYTKPKPDIIFRVENPNSAHQSTSTGYLLTKT